MRTGMPGEIDPENDEGAAPVSPPPTSVSAGAQPSPASVSNSVFIVGSNLSFMLIALWLRMAGKDLNSSNFDLQSKAEL
jgi:hypothetical protein